MTEKIYEITMGRFSDIESIVQFQLDMAMESESTILDKDKVKQGVTAVMNDTSKGIYWVAKTNGNPIGSLMITKEWSDWNNSWYWWIQSVYVTPEHRGKGVFKRMYNKVIELVRSENISQVRLYVDKNNLTAQQVYEKLGMKECHYYMYETNSKV